MEDYKFIALMGDKAADFNINVTSQNLRAFADYLIEKAKTVAIESVFILTTQTADWFEKQGFISDKNETLPEKRREKWNPQRGSKLFRLRLKN